MVGKTGEALYVYNIFNWKIKITYYIYVCDTFCLKSMKIYIHICLPNVEELHGTIYKELINDTAYMDRF